jgi:hypothetical protein
VRLAIHTYSGRNQYYGCGRAVRRVKKN